jgi:hypothetical protein
MNGGRDIHISTLSSVGRLEENYEKGICST